MALEMATPPATPSSQVVGNAFVEQYYHILYNSPELAHRFYHDSSVLSRPDSNGVMTSVTTMQGINEKILSLDYKNYKAEINTADAQKSYKEGVTVLVTGCLMGKDNLKRKFAQSFFLAPQDNGYFVLNDVFRYVEDGESLENQKVNGVYDAPIEPSAAEHVISNNNRRPSSCCGDEENFIQSFRGRGNYVGNRSFGRNEYGNHGEFSGRPRGSAWRGRGDRPSGAKQTPSNSNPI
ncbi:Nuclear transport factor 2 family protein with RNA binding domain isoform 1 [Hibiscus syriacus]|uniref:Nuclear transport factor 2 family protein with RNA binding domain isoform 1 n=1 Tax=Hibiscus syriacus TaxID=106335 RepID=A0A6A2X2P5_HIBSY|nr:Nuclear transport factor 2 family protein with RNA binding domain isoform 1 [Hibiscus syriacus]